MIQIIPESIKISFMILQKKIITLFISLAISLTANVAFSQQLVKDPAGGMDENELEASESKMPAVNSAMPVSINNSLMSKYYSSWDTLYVRRSSVSPPDVGDFVSLPLFNDNSTGFVFPIEGTFLSPFGKRGHRVHSGVDIKLEAGDPVGAAFDGVVRMARYYSGYGNCVVIRHFNGLETLYGHLSKIKVTVSQQVKAGDVIGLGGRTGRATCNHLHFETRFQGKPFNPKQLINFDSYALLSDTFAITRTTYGLTRDYLPKASSNEIAAVDETQHSKTTTKSSKSKKYHTIKNGDTLYAVSLKYGTSVKQLCSINGIKSTKTLKLGTKIRVR